MAANVKRILWPAALLALVLAATLCAGCSTTWQQVRDAICATTPGTVEPAPTPTPPVDPEAFDLKRVKWVHATGQDISSWPVVCSLDSVTLEPPYLTSRGYSWPATWPKLGPKGVQANHVVIAKINGQWYGGAWEAMRLGMPDRRPLECLTNLPVKCGAFGQVEKEPFYSWEPEKGDKIGFMVTSWIRSHVAQPVGRSEVVWTVWP